MRIRIERRGGFAGRPAVGERDESELSPQERTALKHLLEQPPPATRDPGADRFYYIVSVEDHGEVKRLEVAGDAMPDALASIAKITL
jgi:hypothetical protein